MSVALLFIVLGIGAIVGSFLNALLWRLHSGESMLVGRSHCTRCGHVLGALDLVPVFSFLALRGRCRHCSEAIHPSYLAVEVATATIFAALAAKAYAESTLLSQSGLAALLIAWFVAASCVVVFVYDLKYMLIPRRVTTAATVVAFVGGVLLGADPLRLAFAVIVGAGVFFLQYALSNGRWIGGGDIHVGAMMGAALGWPLVVLALFVAYVIGAIYGLWLIASKQRQWKSEIPFGTFLTASTVFCLLYGERLLGWYLAMLR